MSQGKVSNDLEPVGTAEVLKFGPVENARSILDQIVRDGARKMLQAALEDEVNAFHEMHSTKVDEYCPQFDPVNGPSQRAIVRYLQ